MVLHRRAKDWKQRNYTLKVAQAGQETEYNVDSSESVSVPWPAQPLKARGRVKVSVQAIGEDAWQTPWASLCIETGLLSRTHWQALRTTCDPSAEGQGDNATKRPYRLRKKFTVPHDIPDRTSRLYVKAYGVYEIEINGKCVGDHVLAPGWQSYTHRLAYQTFDIGSYLLPGENVVGAWVGEGWYSGRLGFRGGVRDIYGDRPGLRSARS